MRIAAPSLAYLGRSTIRLMAKDGSVAYIDPFAPGDYSVEADLILVTHGHGDHNRIELVRRRPPCAVAGPRGATQDPEQIGLALGETRRFGPFEVRAVPAENRNHPRESTFGFVVAFDGVRVYHASDTSFLPEMASLADLSIDYALFPVDGYWNMDGAEAARCAEAVKPRFALAIHSSPNGLYDEARAASFRYANALPLRPGTAITLDA